jgi:hypothetical protein
LQAATEEATTALHGGSIGWLTHHADHTNLSSAGKRAMLSASDDDGEVIIAAGGDVNIFGPRAELQCKLGTLWATESIVIDSPKVELKARELPDQLPELTLDKDGITASIKPLIGDVALSSVSIKKDVIELKLGTNSLKFDDKGITLGTGTSEMKLGTDGRIQLKAGTELVFDTPLLKKHVNGIEEGTVTISKTN